MPSRSPARMYLQCTAQIPRRAQRARVRINDTMGTTHTYVVPARDVVAPAPQTNDPEEILTGSALVDFTPIEFLGTDICLVQILAADQTVRRLEVASDQIIVAEAELLNRPDVA